MKPSGKIHTCAVCGKKDVWGKSWSWYGSLRDLDDDQAFVAASTTCSDECKAKWQRPSAPVRETARERKARERAERDAIVARSQQRANVRLGWCGPR